MTALGAALFAAVLLAGTPAQAPRRYSLDECIEVARNQNREVALASAKVDESAAARKRARGRFGPMLNAEAGLQYWDDEVTVDFLPADLELPIPLEMEPMVVQEQLTSTTSTSAIQPLTSLWAISEGYLAMSHGERASKHERDAKKQDVVLSVTSAYLGALKTEKLVEVTRLSVEQIQAHVERAEAFHRAGVLGLEQVLEAKVRLAEANSGLAQAEGGLQLARSNLAFQMGLPVDEEVVPSPIWYDRLPTIDTDEERGFQAALSRRPELAAANSRVRQATAGRRAAWASMLPQVSAIGSYQHTEGSSFMRKDQFFIGLSASWTFWEWGATAYGVPEARARERQAKLGKELMREGLRLEIRKARIEIDVARKQVEAAKVAIEQAEENLRIVERRFEANAATTTDVLDAVALQARARIGEVTAFYDYLQAVAKFRRATGEPIVFDGATTSRKG